MALGPSRSLDSRFEERFHRRGDGRRLVVMQHVARIRDRHHPAVRNVREAAPDGGERVGGAFAFRMIVEPLRDVRVRGGDPQRRRRDVAPHRVRLLDPVHGRKRQLVARIGGQAHATVRQRLGPMPREKRRLVARQSRVVLLQAIGDRVEARVGREVLADRRARRATSRISPAPRPIPPRARRSRRAKSRGARAPGARRRSAARRCRRGCGRRDRRSRRARTPAAAPRGRRCSRRTSSPAAATRSSRSRAGPARSRTTRARTHRPETGTTPRRPSSRAAERASGAAGSPQVSTCESRPRSATRCERYGFIAATATSPTRAPAGAATRVTSSGTTRGRRSSRCGSCRRRRSARRPCAPVPSRSRSRPRSPADTASGNPERLTAAGGGSALAGSGGAVGRAGGRRGACRAAPPSMRSRRAPAAQRRSRTRSEQIAADARRRRKLQTGGRIEEADRRWMIGVKF